VRSAREFARQNARTRHSARERRTRTPIAWEKCGSYIRVQRVWLTERGYCVDLPQRRCSFSTSSSAAQAVSVAGSFAPSRLALFAPPASPIVASLAIRDDRSSKKLDHRACARRDRGALVTLCRDDRVSRSLFAADDVRPVRRVSFTRRNADEGFL